MTTVTARNALALASLAVIAGCASDIGPVDPALRERGTPLLSTSSFGEWSAPVNFGPVVNSTAIDNSPELSKDGLSLYFGSTRPGGFGSTDLYVSQRPCTDTDDDACAWGAPVNLGATLNTSRIDGGPHLSRDGHWLYLISDRPGGFGSNDIYVSWRADIHDDFAWEAPVNLGPPINTELLEAGPNLRGGDFYFHRGPMTGNADIYMSRMRGHAFDEPVLVAEVSSPVFFDQRPSTTWDGKEMILSSNRPGGLGDQDIYYSVRQSNAAPWTTPVNLGAPINTPFLEQTPTISDDGTILLFSSNRTGHSDLYFAIREKR